MDYNGLQWEMMGGGRILKKYIKSGGEYTSILSPTNTLGVSQSLREIFHTPICEHWSKQQ